MNKYIYFFCAAIIALSACSKDAFNKYPDTVVTPPEQALSTVADVKYWQNGFYTALRARVYGDFMQVTDIQADFLVASASFGNNYGAPHRWDFTAEDYDVRDIYGGYYSGIANLNYFLKNVDNVELYSGEDAAKVASEKATVATAKGEAHILRAFYYYNLVLRFAKDYEPSTASSDLGVVIMSEDEDPVHDRLARSTVAETYQFIENDIVLARTYFTEAGVVAKYTALNKIGKDAMDAFEARVALSTHKYDKAAELSESLLSKYTLAANQQALFNVWRNDSNASEVILRLSTVKAKENPNANNVYLQSSTYRADYGITYYTPYFYPTERAINLYAPADWRYDCYFSAEYCAHADGYIRGTIAVTKYLGNPGLYTNPNQPNFQQAPIVFRIAEQYLINAEANYKLGNETKALTAINDLRVKRGLTALAILTGTNLFDAIKTERTMEMMYEGVRIDDLKRWGDPMPMRGNVPAASGGVTTHVYTGVGYTSLSKPAGDNKFVWGIPKNDQSTNKNIVQNPGW